MGLKGKMIAQTVVKHSGVGDLFHGLFVKDPHNFKNVAPQKVQGFTLLSGGIGVAGSKICWNYFHDGKDRVAKQIIDNVDEVNQSMTLRMVEGDLMEEYKSMIATYHVDTKGEDNLITWTVVYEKVKEDTPHPGTLMNFFLHMVEDVEAHHLSKA